MPLRTDRGRAAVYRRLWGWPLRSRRHLAAAVTAAAVLVIGVSTAASAVQDHQAAGHQPAPPAHQQARAPIPAPPRPQPAPPAPVPPEAVTTAADFANQWVNHPPGMPAQVWLGQLQPLTEPELLVSLSEADPSRVPETQVTGAPTVVQSADQVATVAVPTDAGPLTVTVATSPAGWRVHQVDGAR